MPPLVTGSNVPKVNNIIDNIKMVTKNRDATRKYLLIGILLIVNAAIKIKLVGLNKLINPLAKEKAVMVPDHNPGWTNSEVGPKIGMIALANPDVEGIKNEITRKNK